ncbi:hypothetical protein GCM10007939_09530 [Amylibacter marinus]|uniref:Uncharacterized protein n=1 Tax=Amylibacter marinus TaxID=1475483 RepID=A0ABQ5VTB4_9RHOB|nr:hypothetical protein [Amylibacter marinus]GLQ34670.1 hypothetical protein GCM10007939_09530 [Amylibacter marinus]
MPDDIYAIRHFVRLNTAPHLQILRLAIDVSTTYRPKDFNNFPMKLSVPRKPITPYQTLWEGFLSVAPF